MLICELHQHVGVDGCAIVGKLNRASLRATNHAANLEEYNT